MTTTNPRPCPSPTAPPVRHAPQSPSPSVRLAPPAPLETPVLGAPRVREAPAALAAGGAQDHEEVLARASWSRVAEPGDVAATALVGALGARGALRWLTEEAMDGDRPREAPRPPVASQGDPARASRAWRAAAERWAPRLVGLDVRRELDVLARLGGTVLVPGDPRWPGGLDELEHPPHCLWVRGDPDLLTRPRARLARGGSSGTGESRRATTSVAAGAGEGLCVAIVGSRAATAYGERVTRRLAVEVTAGGCLVVSGGAYGIDAAAHRGALESGPTVAVSAGGVDRFYPAGNAALLEAVVAEGALVAEVPPGSQPGRHRFLTRNRLIAALTSGTVVVEAAWRSGALSTARHARDLGRPLGAVPGPVTSMESAGCHRLLRDGAVCVTDAEEVLELIAPLGSVDPDARKVAEEASRGAGLLDGLGEVPSAILDAMPARSWADLGALTRSSGRSEREVLSGLGLLELEGRVQREGNRWRRGSPG